MKIDPRGEATTPDTALTRRGFLKTSLTAGALLPIAGAFVGAGAAYATSHEDGEKLVTEVPAAAPIVQALQYTNESAKPDQNCAGCQLYTAGKDGNGKCQLFQQGLVKEAGWCASWAKKVA